MAVTIMDIAKEVGVSPSTVSRVISGKAKISDETKDKINKAMKKMNYYPNSQARSLATGLSNMIGLVINTNQKGFFSNVFFNSSVFGIEKIIQDNNYNLLITNNQKNNEKNTSVEKLLFENKVDGLILPPSILSSQLIKDLKISQTPYVILGEPAIHKNTVNWVDINNYSGAILAVEHLKKEGFKNIGYIGGNVLEVFSTNRIRGYKDTIENDEKYYKCESDKDLAFNLALDILSKNKIDALVCNDNIVAYSVIKAAKKLGIKIPNELGLVTFDNFPLAEFTDPELTAICIDTYQQGEQAAKMLFESIKGNQTIRNTMVNPTIVIRESSRRNK